MNKYTDRIGLIRQRAHARGMLAGADNPIGIKAGLWGRGGDRAMGVKSVDGKLEVVCYANTSAVDLEREVVVPTGLDVRSYLTTNKNLFVDHRYDVLSAVAVCRSMTLDPGGWLCRGAFHDDMANPYVKACVALAKAGTLAMSVGFEALDWGPPTDAEAKAYPGVESVVRKARVLEVSYTAMPMNVTCRQVASNLASNSETAEKCRKALIDAHISGRVIEDFGIRPKKVLILRG